MKSATKIVLFYASTVIIAPLLLFVFLFSSRVSFQGCSQLLSLVPFRLGVYLRAAFYSHVCHSVDREIAIGFATLFSHQDTDLGKHVYIGAQCNIGSCSIGSDTLLGSGVHLLSGKQQHNISDGNQPIRLQGGEFIKINIGENCWIGNNATVMSNVGAGTIIAAGSVVVHDIPENVIAAGNPAVVIKSR